MKRDVWHRRAGRGSDRSRGADSVAAMTRALARRGPDGEGVEVWDGAVLGHRRLAILT